MPAPCSLLLEVFSALSIYDDAIETVDWEASTDPDHTAPYLVAPQNYAAQEIDPIRCTAQIGTIEVGVIDVPQVPGDQSSGWMTARVHDLLGRRCRLRRWISVEVGWVVIADGPAGPPHMDASYAGYRWTIRDTRETERKLTGFLEGGVATIVPRGALYGFGEYTDDYDAGTRRLLPRIIDTPVTGVYYLQPIFGIRGVHWVGGINLAALLASDVLILDQAAQDAIQTSEIATGRVGCLTADVLWRMAGDTIWNVARPTAPSSFPQPFASRTDGTSSGGDAVQKLNFVSLFIDEVIPPGFPTVEGGAIECIVRYRGPASTDFPYYVEGTLGDVLRNLYNGVYTLAAKAEISGLLYDPDDMDHVPVGGGFRSRIRFDSGKLDTMLDRVLLRQASPIADARGWAETMLYAPSGWVPALDATAAISPINRSIPVFLDHAVDDDVTVPNPNWQTGETTVSQIIYTYPRYFLPSDPSIETDADGLATRQVILEFTDGESQLRYGEQIQEYDASAFSAVGDDQGINLPGVLEPASLMAQNAKFDVLDRYREGAQSITVQARRDRLPTAQVGDWVPWSLMHLPDRLTGLRGSNAALAQILSLRDDDCVWRTLVLEESGLAAGAPGYASNGLVIDDEPGVGGGALTVLSDEESY